MDLGPHATYIVIAYLGVAALTIALIVSAFSGARRQQSHLDDLQAQGVRRRSDDNEKA